MHEQQIAIYCGSSGVRDGAALESNGSRPSTRMNWSTSFTAWLPVTLRTPRSPRFSSLAADLFNCPNESSSAIAPWTWRRLSNASSGTSNRKATGCREPSSRPTCPRRYRIRRSTLTSNLYSWLEHSRRTRLPAIRMRPTGAFTRASSRGCLASSGRGRSDQQQMYGGIRVSHLVEHALLYPRIQARSGRRRRG